MRPNNSWPFSHNFPQSIYSGLRCFLQAPRCLYLQFLLFTDDWWNSCSNTCPESMKWCFAIYHLIFNADIHFSFKTLELPWRGAFDDNCTTSNRLKNGGITGDKQSGIKQTNQRVNTGELNTVNIHSVHVQWGDHREEGFRLVRRLYERARNVTTITKKYRSII